MKQFRASLGFNVVQLASPITTQIKLTKTLGGVVFFYLLSYVPASILSIFMFGKPSDIIRNLNYVTLLFWYTNYWINPFLYGAKNKDFKKAFKKLLGIGKMNNQVQDFAN